MMLHKTNKSSVPCGFEQNIFEACILETRGSLTWDIGQLDDVTYQISKFQVLGFWEDDFLSIFLYNSF